jgi:hypothetical protein
MRSNATAIFKPQLKSSMALATLLPYGLVLTIALYLLLSTQTLLILRWHYVGGGSAIEKLHPATYLLAVALSIALFFDSRFRRLFFQRISSDLFLVSFLAAVLLTAAYTVFLKTAPATSFFDTFLAAILATIAMTCVPSAALLFLRRIVDLFFVFNIFLIFRVCSPCRFCRTLHGWSHSHT